MLSADHIAASTGATEARATTWLDAINSALDEFEINTQQRQAMFLAQIGHESGSLVYTHELWGPTGAQKGYEGRADLGNTQAGDGFLYRGRGLIQITGRANYAAASMGLDIDCLNNPDLLAAMDGAARSAGWFWMSHNLNAVADSGDFIHCTKVINGGTNGLAHRQQLYAAARHALGLAS